MYLKFSRFFKVSILVMLIKYFNIINNIIVDNINRYQNNAMKGFIKDNIYGLLPNAC